MLNDKRIQEIKDLGKSVGKDILKEIIELYKSETPSSIDEMRSHLANKDMEKIARAAHKLKASCANLGFDEMTHICNEIESKAANLSAHQLELKFDVLTYLFVSGVKELERL
jgi:HPt (histidine-containing phosphotransfer) domain-containing protein